MSRRAAPRRARIAPKGLDPDVVHVEPTKPRPRVIALDDEDDDYGPDEDDVVVPRKRSAPAGVSAERLHRDAVEARGRRLRAEHAEERVVTAGRAFGWSWDRLGRELGLSGETLRRRYAGRV